MKVTYSDRDETLFRSACPDCDLPLTVRDYHGVGYDLCWLHDEQPVVECPRCGHDLPALTWNHQGRHPELVALNEILAGMGEPPTCMEEVERCGVDLAA